MFDKTVAEMLTIGYNTNTEQMFCIRDQQRRVQWLIRASVFDNGNDHYISRYGSDGYGKSVVICNTA